MHVQAGSGLLIILHSTRLDSTIRTTPRPFIRRRRRRCCCKRSAAGASCGSPGRRVRIGYSRTVFTRSRRICLAFTRPPTMAFASMHPSPHPASGTRSMPSVVALLSLLSLHLLVLAALLSLGASAYCLRPSPWPVMPLPAVCRCRAARSFRSPHKTKTAASPPFCFVAPAAPEHRGPGRVQPGLPVKLLLLLLLPWEARERCRKLDASFS